MRATQINRIILLSGLITVFITSTALADTSLWSGSTSDRFSSAQAAATFQINAGATSSASAKTTLNIYNSSNCTGLVANISVTGAYTFHNPSIVNANGASIYSIINAQGTTPSTINSIQVTPIDSNDNALFQPSTACFNVNCSLNACVSSTVQSVTLQ